ncbi:General stress protein CTC [compost metagenome]
MAMTLKVENRQELTKSEIKQLRTQGKIPGVIYGSKVGNKVISIDKKDLVNLLRENPHGIIELDIAESGKQTAMVNEVQRNPMDREILHIDFHQINMNEPVKTVVTLEFVGESQGTHEGGIVQILLHELEIRCLPQDIPTALQVDISSLGLGENLHVSDVKIPPNIEIKSDLNESIVTILVPQKEVKVDSDVTEDTEKIKEEVSG